MFVVALFAFLFYFSKPLIGEVMAWHWQPEHGHYGLFIMIIGSFLASVLAVLLALPISIGLASFAVVSKRKIVLEIIYVMTSVPTIVYAFVAAIILVPFLRSCFIEGTGYSWLATSLMLAMLVLPTMTLTIYNGLNTRYRHYQTTTTSLGLTINQTLLWVIMPLLGKDIITATLLGFSRAIGDTILALVLSGNALHLPNALWDSMRTMTAHIVLITGGNTQDIGYNAIFIIGLLLFVISIAINSLLYRWRRG